MIVDLELTALAHGPYAIGRHEGQAVLVRGGAPGDQVRVRVVERHARHLVASLAEVRRPGAARRAAPCPFHPTCGGCPWQQVSYSEQLAAKAANVRREIARATGDEGVVAEPRAAPAEWAYRRRIRLHVDRDRRIGFMRAESHRVVEIDACLVAEPAVSAAIAPARALIGRLRTPIEACEISARGELPGVALGLAAAGPLARRDRSEVERFLAAVPGVAGVVIAGTGWTRTWGQTRLRLRGPQGGVASDVPPLAFSQVNDAANRLLIEAAVAAATAPGAPPGARALELHAGAGNLTLALAPAFARLHAVEGDGRAAVALRRAVRRLPQITVERARAAEALLRLQREGAAFDLALVDPPRTGLKEEIPGLLALRPRRLVYVSCDLPTFARDTRALLAGGYRLARVDLVDLFPQTFHVELVGRFEFEVAA